MAQYRLSVYVASRSENRNGIAMAAYRAAERLTDPKTGETIDYTRKQGVIHSEIIAPENAPEWATNRQELWSRSEATHKMKKAVVAREIQLSLPHELNNAERRELTTEFARFMSDSYKVAVDMSIHAPNKQGDDRNYHAHLLLCTRPFDAGKPNGLGNNVRDFDAIAHQKTHSENHVETWRVKWEQQINDALERADIREADGTTVVSVSHKSHARRGLEDEPTIKEGTAATAKDRRGEHSDRAAENDEIRARNEENARLREEIRVEAQELDLLVRRQAQMMEARDAQRAIAPTKDPTETLAPREAKDRTAPGLERELTADNDNAPETTTPKYTPFKGESEAQFAARLERMKARDEREQQREKEQPKLELHYRPSGPTFGR
jgi:hypothetical protein